MSYVILHPQDLGLNLVTVLDNLRIQRVVGLGDGAGANIITRYRMERKDASILIILGLVFVILPVFLVLSPLTIQHLLVWVGSWTGLR